MNIKKRQGETYTINVGEKLKKVIEKQKEIVKEWGWGEINLSDYEAGEILAEKIIKNNLVN